MLVVLIDDAGFGSSSAFGGPCATPNAERLAGHVHSTTARVIAVAVGLLMPCVPQMTRMLGFSPATRAASSDSGVKTTGTIAVGDPTRVISPPGGRTAGQGLEPQLPEPESGVLPITPPGNGRRPV